MSAESTKSKSKTPAVQASRNKGAATSFFPGKEGSSLRSSHPESVFFKRSRNERMERLGIQPSLKLHPADDVYEREAEKMADLIVSQNQHRSAASDDPPSSTSPGLTSVQRQRAFESPSILEQNSAHGGEETDLQRQENGEAQTTEGLESQLSATKDGGQPLGAATQEKMEPGLGADLSGVRVHDSAAAIQMSRQLGARAFTHGSDIYFNEGEYRPGTREGDHLLAHELTHTVQQGGVQRKAIQKAGNAPLTPDQLDAIPPSKSGKIEMKGVGVELTLTNLIIKGYADPAFAKKQGPKLKKPVSGTRKTSQGPIWKDAVRNTVRASLEKIVDPTIRNDLLALEIKKNPTTKMIGSFDQILEKILVPLWNKKGDPAIFQIEHLIDWQVLGPAADHIDNLMLLNVKTNKLYGDTIKAKIESHIENILNHYRSKGLTQLPKEGKTALNEFGIFYETESFTADTVQPGDIIFKEDLERDKASPIRPEFINVKKASIPDGYMILKTNKETAGYMLPYNTQNQRIGGFFVTTKGDAKNSKLTYVRLDPIVTGKKSIIKRKIEDEGAQYEELGDKTNVFVVHSMAMSLKIKQLIAINGMSPVEFSEIEMDGFDIKAKGKVLSDLSFLKGVDINISLENGEVSIQALLPLDQLKSKIPKPFELIDSNVAITLSSSSGLEVSGMIKFKIGNFGEGKITASMGNTLSLDGSFDFNSKWFKPATINVDYKNGKWSIGGTIGIEDGTIKGVKKATLTVKYAKETFSADGSAQLDVPGIDSVKLSAEYTPGAGFRFVAQADLKKLPGIKSGSVTVSILSKGEGGDIKLGVGGTAVPDLPNIPGLTAALTVIYEDGIFDMRAKVGYKKGRFDGMVEVGVSNRAVNEKGEPQGEPEKGPKTYVFGYGQLTVDLFKGSKGTIRARYTPDQQLLVAGEFSVRDFSPFGPGVNLHKKIIDFPSIKIPIFGVPGVSIFFEISGGSYFRFNWQPLVLKELTIGFRETNINELETAQVDIKGALGSKAVAEAYMEIKASLGAEVLIAEIRGSLGGQAGVSVEGEAGGEVIATWNNEKGLQLKEINATVSVNPKAIFRLTGSISVDLDLWVTTINLYYKEWVLAESSMDLGGLALKVGFPLKFTEEGDLIRPEMEQLNVEQPKFDGDQGKAVLDGGINAEAQKERKLAKDKLRADIARDMRNATDEEFSPTEYAKKLQKKYKDDEDMKTFIMDSVMEEVKIREYQEFENLKKELRVSELPLQNRIARVRVFKLFRAHISMGDVEAFIAELYAIEQNKQLASQQASAMAPASP